MTITIPNVNPGDLITADFMNQIIAALGGLDTRVSKLEGASSVTHPVRIDGFTASQPVHVNDQIEVDGAGFLIPVTLNAVTMGGTPVTSFATLLSNSNKLIFSVPPIANIPNTGTAVTVTVTNANGTATSPQILVFPANIVPTGATQLLYTTPPVMPQGGTNITAGQNYTFTFTLTAVTSSSVTYAITPTITGAGWSTQLLDSSPVQVTANATQPIHVQVTPAAGAAGTATLSLSAVETTPGTQVSPASIPLAITLGSPPPTPDNRVRVVLRTAGGGASISGGVVQFVRNQSGGVGFTVLVTQAGSYTVNPTMRNTAGWTRNSLDISGFQVNQPAEGQTANQDINVFFTGSAGAANTDLLFAVTRGTDLSVTYVQLVTIA
jgi:hypothetical protein